MSSTCTGEKISAHITRNTREIAVELVKILLDVEAFYEKYGLKK